MNAPHAENSRLNKAQRASVLAVYVLLALSQVADLHSTSIGLKSGRVELNPLALLASSVFPPFASVVLLKIVAGALFAALLRTWLARDDAAYFYPHVLTAGLIPLIATVLITWRNYA